MNTALIVGDLQRGITEHYAADRGYRVSVLADGCADDDAGVHESFMAKIFPSRGFEVALCADWH